MQKKAQLSRHAIAGVIATASVAVMIWNMGGLGERVAWMLTLLPFGFLYLWTFWLSARARAVWVLVLAISGGVVMAHVLFWGPLLMGSYAIGLGPRHLDYALLAGLLTALLVGWYMLVESIWQIGLMSFFSLAALWVVPRVTGATGQSS